MDAVLAAVRVPAVALGSLAGYGVGTSTGAVTFNALLQAETPAEARGRVFAAFDLIWQLGRLASLALGGWLADTAGIAAVYAAGAALLAAAAGIGRAGPGRHEVNPCPPGRAASMVNSGLTIPGRRGAAESGFADGA